MRKILHIITDLNVGGAELVLERLVKSHQDDANYLHMVISLISIGKIGLQMQAHGVEVHALGLQSPFSILRVLWQLVRRTRAARPDIVQTWMYHADFLGGLAARLAGNRNVIWGVRATDVATGGSRATVVVRRMCAWLSWWIPSSIVCAAEASRRAHVALGYDAAQMVVIPNGFDLAGLVATADQRTALREKCGFSVDDVVIGSLGRFNPDKDQESFVRAAGRLVQQNTQVRFLLVGRGPS